MPWKKKSASDVHNKTYLIGGLLSVKGGVNGEEKRNEGFVL